MGAYHGPVGPNAKSGFSKLTAQGPPLFDPSREMERFHALEYGETGELVTRFAGVFFASVLLYLYTGWLAALAWSAVYFLLHALHFRFLSSRTARATMRDVTMAQGLYLAILASFVWMPAVMAGHSDTILCFMGAVMIATAMTFLIRRADRSRRFLMCQIGVIGAMWLAIVGLKGQWLGTVPQQAAVFVAAMTATLYVAQAMLISRRTRLEAEAAAERAAQEQKMSAIGRLAGGVAHDFNNVLTVLKGNLELYRELDDPSEREEVLRAAFSAIDRAEGVVRQLQVYAGKAPLQRRMIECNALLDRTCGLLASTIPGHITLACPAEAPPHHVETDETLLTAALINLVRNAVDAMPKAGTIAIASRPVTIARPLALAGRAQLAPGTYARISVSDEGHGIPAAHLKRVLDPFYTTRAVGQGTGLGLSMVQGFAGGAGGGMTIDNSDSGTLVCLYLPLADDPDTCPASPETQNAAPGDGVLAIN